METLPQEVVAIILSNCDIETLLKTKIVSKLFHVEANRILNSNITYYPEINTVELVQLHDKKGNTKSIIYYKNGKRKREDWKNKDDKLHRLDGPATKGWYKHGQKEYEGFWVNYELHRSDGPAMLLWYENGQIWENQWFMNHKKHRLDAPAVIKWSQNGDPNEMIWYKNGRRLNGIHSHDGTCLVSYMKLILKKTQINGT